MKGVNATMAIPVLQPVCTFLEPISSPVVSLGQPNKELLKEVESRPTERGSSEVLLTEAHKPEAESGPSTQTKSSFSDEDETGSQSILLVEDVSAFYTPLVSYLLIRLLSVQYRVLTCLL
jgi:hypothetical protein